jgi:hypothetical protein
VGNEVNTGEHNCVLALVSVGLAVYAYTEHREVAYLTLRADHLERRITQLESGSQVAYLTLRADALEERINELEANTPLDDLALRQVMRNSQVDYLALRRRTDALEERIEAPPEPTAVAEPLPAASGSEPMVYTDQQILESRDQGPYRPECAGVRARAMTVPTWLRGDFFEVFGCATVEDRLDQLERQQKWGE